MTYSALETSVASGSPVELYEFIIGTTQLTYCSGDATVVHLLNTYAPYSIKRTQIEEVTEMNRSGIKISVPRNCPVADLFRIAPPAGVLTVKIYRQHRGDTDYSVIWSGRVTSCEWLGGEAELSSEPIYTSIKRNGLRRFYQISCPHLLYSASCGVSRELFALPVSSWTLTSATSLLVPAASLYADGYFAGGYIKWVDSDIFGIDNRLITSHVGGVLTISSSIPKLESNASITIYTGCDHSIDVCSSRFDNEENYGGFVGMPDNNPFGGTMLF